MPRLLSNRKPVARPGDLKENRWEYLNLQQAQPALGLAPEANTGFTLETDENGKVTYTNTLGRLEFDNQVISSTLEGENIEINSSINGGEIVLTPFQTARVAGNLSVEGDAIVDGDFTVRGVPYGTAPLVSNTLYVTPDGNDENDGTSMDATRACRTISGAVRSPFYQPGTAIKVMAGTYFEDNPIPLKPYTSVVGNDLRTTFVEPLNKDLDLFHVNSGVYIAQMQMRNLRRGAVERYAPGGAGTYTTGAYCVAFPPNLENPIDVYYSPYVQNCTNQSGPWLKDGTMMVPNQTVQIPLAAGTSTWTAGADQITVTLYTGTVVVGMALNDAANEGYRNAQLLLKRNREFLQKQTIAYVEDSFPELVYDQAKCYRDVGYIVDAVAGDARFGGNKRSIEAGLAYWSGNNTLIPGEQNETISAISYLRDISLQVITNTTVTNIFNTLSNQVIDLNLDNGSVVYTRASNSFNLITDIIANGESSAPDTPTPDLLGLIYPTGLSPNDVNVATTVTDVTQLSTNTYLITLSTSTVSPSDNATIYFGYTTTYPYLDADVPPEWSSDLQDGFVDRRLDPIGSGGGALVDGNAPSLRSPIQSFVFDAFTQLNQGGIGIHIINNGYAQLVSVFTIMCSQAVIVENGGIASITNSNANFGDTCLTAKGLGKLAFQGFVVNPAYPTNVPNGEYYPLGYWPQKQVMEVFIPSDRDRPHIGQVMEVVPPDTYLNYEGDRVPFINEAGYPGYLIATVNTNTITTGSFIVNDIDVTGVSVGHTLYVRDIYGNETHPVTGVPYVTTGTQVVDVNYRQIVLDRPILSGYSDLTNPNFFNLYFCGNAYYTVLSSNIDSSLASTVTTEVTLVAGQETTTSLAVSYAKKLALKVIQNEPVNGFVYDQAKCARDTGLIVDSLALDLLHPTSELSQTNFAGLQYWNQENYVGSIAGEITTTTNAVRYIKGLAAEIVQGITTGTRYQSTFTQNTGLPLASSIEANIVSADFDVMIDILTDGIAGVTDKIVPNGTQSSDTGLANAYSLLLANKEYIQHETIAYIEETKFDYDQAKCYRDSGLIVDAITLDLLYPTPTYSQSTFAGLQYWNQGGYTGLIDRELTTTTNAINYINDLAQRIVQNITTGTRYQSAISQDTSLPAASSAEATLIDTEFTLITDILNNGTAGVTDLVVPNSIEESSDANVIKAYDLLIANKAYIQAEAVAFVEATKSVGYEYNQALCLRDAGYMVDSIAFDLLHGGNKQAIQSGVYYYSFDANSTAIPNEIPQTLSAFEFIKQLAQRIVLNHTGTNYQSTVTQNISLTAATSFESELLGEAVDVITNIITDGPSVAPLKAPISLDASDNINKLNAALILEANREYIQAETVAYVDQTQRFEYDRTKCFRDVGYMIDSVAFDLLHPNDSGPSNKQAIQSGVYYYNYTEGSTAIPGEIVQATAAYNYIKDLMPYVIKGLTTSTYQSYELQVTDLTPGTDAEVTKVQTYIDHMVNIINVGPSAAEIRVPINLTESTDPNVYNAYLMLNANRRFLQEEIIAFINATFDSGAYQSTYSQVFDATLTGGADAIESLGDKFDIISGIIINGAESSPDIVRPRQYVDSNQNILNAKKLLDKNRSFIQSETVAFVDSLWPSKFSYDPVKCSRDTGLIVDALAQDMLFDGTSQSTFAGIQYWNQGLTVIPGEQTTTTNAIRYLKDFATKIISNDTSGYRFYDGGYTYDRVKCARDTGLIVDALAQDLLFNGESQSTFAGIQYWNQGGYTGLISSEITTTTNAIEYVKTLAAEVVVNTTGTRYQSTVTQYVAGAPATSAEVTTIETDFDVILDILNNGTDGVTDRVVPNGLTASSNGYVLAAYTSLMSNKSFIQTEAVAFVESTKTPGFTYDQAKCYRDVGYIVDSIAFDLLYGGNKQAIQSGVYYYSYNGSSTAVPNEIAEVTAAYDYIKSIVPYIVKGQTTSTFQENVAQVISANTGTNVEASFVQDLVDVITNIINNGPSEVTNAEKEPIGLTRSVDTNVINAALLLNANREFIKAETVAYIDNKFNAGFVYDQTKCERDTGLIVDSIAFDLLYDGNTQSTFAGLQYWNQNGYTGNIASELTTTSNAIAYVRNAVVEIAAAIDPTIAAGINTNFNKILYILNTGTNGVTDDVVPNGLASTDADVVSIYDAILSNKANIQSDTIDWINSTNPTYSYNTATCSRDVGYIIDSVAFDLLHGGNRQSIMSGVYYYDFNAASTTIRNEIPQTTAAYSYIRSIVDDIIEGRQILTPYQTSVRQETDLPAGSATESATAQAKIDIITGIINNGPGSVTREPISLTASTNTNVVEAFNMLLANKDFIKAETIAFLEATFNAVSSQIPNAVTAPTSVVTKVQQGFDIIIDILENGTDGITDQIVPNGLDQSETVSVRAAYDALQANKRLIQNEIVTYVDQMNNFVYDQVKCARDTGLIVDAIALDMKYPTTEDSQSTFAGLQYWNQDGYTGEIERELSTTTGAINYLSSLAQKVVVNSKTGTRYQNTVTQTTSTLVGTAGESATIGTNFNYIVDILGNGPAGITDIIVSNGRPSITTSTVNAYNLLLANKGYLQAEVVAWVEANRQGAYDRAKCYRDSGIIVDSVISDILFPTDGDSQTTFAGLQYWNQNGYTGLIASELTTTTNAINYVNQLAQQVVLNITTGTRYQATVEQTTGTSASSLEALKINNEFSIITNILTNGTDGVTDLVIGNGITASTVTNIIRAYNLLQANKAYIQAEAVAFVEDTKTPGFVYDQTKCNRDVGFMVDSVCFDLLYGGNRQAVQSGVYYYAFDGSSSAIPDDTAETLLAFAHIKEISQQIVMNSTVTTYQSVVKQVRSTEISNTTTVALIGSKFDVITDIITSGPGVAATKEPISLTKSTTTAVTRAAALLNANREFIQAETIAYIEENIAFKYDQAKCYRDVGFMVDSVAFDLLHGGNKQSIQSGVYYYGYDATSTAINNEIPQTTAAYNRIREIIPQIVQGLEVTVSPGNTEKQITYMLPASLTEAATLQSKVDRIVDIINNGPSAAPTQVPISLTASNNALVDRAYDLIMANRDFIKAEIVAYVNNEFTNFEYDKALCYRDVGYILDSVSFDLLYGGNKQAIQSGVYYFGHDGSSTAVPNEIPQTTAAYNFIERIVGDIVTGTLIEDTQQTTVAQVTSIGSQFYSEAKCSRDTGILVDSFITDLLFSENGKTQSNFSGLQYWNQNGYTGLIASELTTTTNAIQYLATLAQEVVINDFRQPALRWQNTVTQVTNVTPATADQASRVAAEFDLILDVLANGTSGITDRVEANGIDVVSDDARAAYDLLLANKEYFAAEVVAYVEFNKSANFEYDKIKCARDVGYIIDSVAFDILYGGNRQAIQSGVYYYGFSETVSAIPTDLEQTLAAYARLKEILPSVVTNTAIVKSPNNGLTQVTTLTTATSAEGDKLEDMVDLISNIIQTGPSVAETQVPVSLIRSTSTSVIAAAEILEANRDFIVEEIVSYINYNFFVASSDEAESIKTNVNLINNIIQYGPDEVAVKEPISLSRSADQKKINAAKLLVANRDFIRAETIAFINNTYNTGFLYDKSKCRRDTGLIVDSIAFDLLYEGTTESTFAGLQYWNQDSYVGNIEREITTTTNAIRYLKEVVQDIVLNNAVVVTTGNIYNQTTNLSTSTQGIADVIASNVDIILDIITNGTTGVTDIIVPNGVASTSTDISNAVALLEANKEFVQYEVVARINLDNPEYEYDRTTCRRDVGYIIDSLIFDLQHGGNRQSVTSGVYYYGFNAADTVIDDQVPQTTAAYNYIRELVDKVVRGTAVATPYQKKVAQVILSDVGTTTEVGLVQDKIDNITNIINNGPAAAPAKEPISLTASTSTAVVNAFNLLLANKAFIQAEVIAHIDAVFTDATNYNKEKCFRDMGAIVDAVGYDLIYGGNYNSVNTGNGYFLRKGQYHLVRLEQNVTDPTLFIDGATVRFYQQSYISASGYLFEYVGAGTQYGALPQVGTADPTQSKEVVQLNNGKVFFTSTDQNGDFRIGPTLVISQSTGVLSGRTFQKSLYAEMTPFILVVGA